MGASRLTSSRFGWALLLVLLHASAFAWGGWREREAPLDPAAGRVTLVVRIEHPAAGAPLGELASAQAHSPLEVVVAVAPPVGWRVLTPLEAVTVSAGERRAWPITLRAPANVATGAHAVTLTLSPQVGEPLRDVALVSVAPSAAPARDPNPAPPTPAASRPTTTFTLTVVGALAGPAPASNPSLAWLRSVRLHGELAVDAKAATRVALDAVWGERPRLLVRVRSRELTWATGTQTLPTPWRGEGVGVSFDRSFGGNRWGAFLIQARSDASLHAGFHSTLAGHTGGLGWVWRGVWGARLDTARSVLALAHAHTVTLRHEKAEVQLDVSQQGAHTAAETWSWNAAGTWQLLTAGNASQQLQLRAHAGRKTPTSDVALGVALHGVWRRGGRDSDSWQATLGWEGDWGAPPSLHARLGVRVPALADARVIADARWRFNPELAVAGAQVSSLALEASTRIPLAGGTLNARGEWTLAGGARLRASFQPTLAFEFRGITMAWSLRQNTTGAMVERTQQLQAQFPLGDQGRLGVSTSFQHPRSEHALSLEWGRPGGVQATLQAQQRRAHAGAATLQFNVTVAVPLTFPTPDWTTGSVHGRVLDAAGAPVANLPILVGGVHGRSDAHGGFHLRGVPAGVHFLRLGPGSPEGVTLTPAPPQGISVQARQGTLVQATLQRNGRIAGRMVVADPPHGDRALAALLQAQAPTLAGIPLTLARAGSTRSTTSANDGSFALEDVPPGVWHASAEAGHLPDGWQWASPTQQVEVQEGATVMLMLAVVPSARAVYVQDGGSLTTP